VHLDGLGGHEERLRNVLVGETFCGEPCHAPLAGRERLDPGEQQPAGARPGRGELLLGLFDERQRPGADGEVEPLLQQLARIGALVRPAQCRAQCDERTSPLEPGRRPLQHRERLA
jgi:hypothetical protein